MAETSITPETVSRRVADRAISGASMVVTVFGDSISQHGGWIGLGSLIEALAPLGFGERLVRTAVFRLAQQDWLKGRKVGRRSYYCFTDDAQAHYQRAAKRIYAAGRKEWDGYWTLVFPAGAPENKRDKFVQSLSWQGFSPLASGVFARPSAQRGELDETIGELDLSGQVVVLQAAAEDPHSQAALRLLAQAKWSLGGLRALYEEFLDFYRPLTRELRPGSLSAEQSFWLRTLMVHDYRRVLLRDPEFPEAVLPTGWIGFSACELMRRTYKILAPSSLQYIQQELENADGPLPPPGRPFYRRFDGLKN